MSTDPSSVAPLMLAWYAKHRRVLPWRALAGKKANPYHVWLSEMMLQQTGVVTVGPYFMRFIERWPRLEDLATAPLDDVMQMWAGLGYYRRARALHEAARLVRDDYKGRFPSKIEDILELPGCGPYTAAAIAAIAFDQKANVVDGNIERVVARLFAMEEPLPEVKKKICAYAERLLPEKQCGDYAQSLMDLGSSVCTPRQPKCDLCPLKTLCEGYKKGIASDLPRRAVSKPKPLRRTLAFGAVDEKGRLYIRKRPLKGLLAGMMEVPSMPWEEGDFPKPKPPFKAKWSRLSGIIRHSFTHFDLEIEVMVARLAKTAPRPSDGKWVSFAKLDGEALPSVMRKIALYVKAAMKEEKE